jgi:hypothetical protein
MSGTVGQSCLAILEDGSPSEMLGDILALWSVMANAGAVGGPGLGGRYAVSTGRGRAVLTTSLVRRTKEQSGRDVRRRGVNSKVGISVLCIDVDVVVDDGLLGRRHRHVTHCVGSRGI